MHEAFGAAPTDYLIVVASRGLKLVSGDHMQRLNPEHPLPPEQAQGGAQLPIDQIFIVYIVEIADFDQAMAAAQKGKFNFPDLLQQAASANQKLVTGRLRLSEHVD